MTREKKARVDGRLESQGQEELAEQLDVAERKLALLEDELARTLRRAEAAKLLYDTLTCLNNLGAILADLGRRDEAEITLRACLEGRRRALGADHPLTIQTLANVGVPLWFQRRLDEAAQLLGEALELRRRVSGSQHAETALALANYGGVLRAARCDQEALDVVREAVALRRAQLPSTHAEVLRPLQYLAGTCERLGRNEGALEALEAILQILEQTGRGSTREALELRERRVLTLHKLGRTDAACDGLQRTLEQRLQLDGPVAADTLDTAMVLGQCMRELGRNEAPFLERVGQAILALDVVENATQARVLIEVANLRLRAGNFELADSCLRAALPHCPPTDSGRNTLFELTAGVAIELYRSWDGALPAEERDA